MYPPGMPSAPGLHLTGHLDALNPSNSALKSSNSNAKLLLGEPPHGHIQFQSFQPHACLTSRPDSEYNGVNHSTEALTDVGSHHAIHFIRKALLWILLPHILNH